MDHLSVMSALFESSKFDLNVTVFGNDKIKFHVVPINSI